MQFKKTGGLVLSVMAVLVWGLINASLAGAWPWGEKEVKRSGDWSNLDQTAELQKTIHKFGGELMANLADHDPEFGDLAGGLIVCSFVELKNLGRTSSLGRYISEQLAGEFQRGSFRVVDIRKSSEVLVQGFRGEYGLSREPEELGNAVAADAMLTGTYTIVADHILVNARILDNRSGVLLSSAVMSIPRCELTELLLSDPASLKRVEPGVLYLKQLEL